MKSQSVKFKVWDKEYNRFITNTLHISLDLNGNVFNLQNGQGNENYVLVQYTGILDKNNKEIYWGDIVKGELTIEEDNFDFVGAIIFEDGQFKCDRADFDLWVYTSLEIVGNIFENPELV